VTTPTIKDAIIPQSFWTESFHQRRETIAALRKRIEELEDARVDEVALEFRHDGEIPRPEIYAQACRTVAILSDRVPAEGIGSVTFRPYPSKYEGAWRIEVGYRRGYGGIACGAEWYVSDEVLWKAWEEAGIPVGQDGAVRAVDGGNEIEAGSAVKRLLGLGVDDDELGFCPEECSVHGVLLASLPASLLVDVVTK
jgi:hypothetical protein